MPKQHSYLIELNDLISTVHKKEQTIQLICNLLEKQIDIASYIKQIQKVSNKAVDKEELNLNYLKLLSLIERGKDIAGKVESLKAINRWQSKISKFNLPKPVEKIICTDIEFTQPLLTEKGITRPMCLRLFITNCTIQKNALSQQHSDLELALKSLQNIISKRKSMYTQESFLSAVNFAISAEAQIRLSSKEKAEQLHNLSEEIVFSLL